MVSIGWLLLAFIIGGYAGAILVGLMSINPPGAGERDMEAAEEADDEDMQLSA